jgi:putative hemolysin
MIVEIVVVFCLFLLNGFFAMAELAIVSSRRGRLQQLAREGRKGAAVALELSRDPGKFLSSVQIGITLIGILSGAFSGATIAEKLDDRLAAYPAIAPYAETLAIALTVVISWFGCCAARITPCCGRCGRRAIPTRG